MDRYTPSFLRPTATADPTGMTLADLINRYVRGFGASLMTPGISPMSMLGSTMPNLSSPLASALLNAPNRTDTGWVNLAKELNLDSGGGGGGHGGGRNGIPGPKALARRGGPGGGGTARDRIAAVLAHRAQQGGGGGRQRSGGGGSSGGRSTASGRNAHADASGGSFTHGNVDPGTHLNVNVSGGTAYASGNKKKRY